MNSRTKVFAPILIAVIAYFGLKQSLKPRSSLPVFTLAVEDTNLKSPLVNVWLKAAREEGLPLELISYDSLYRELRNSNAKSAQVKGIIFPDGVSALAPSTLLAEIQSYVEEGGKVAIVSDALTKNQSGYTLPVLPLQSVFGFPKPKGYPTTNLQYKMDPVQISDEGIKILRVPPGQYTNPDWEGTGSHTHVISTYAALEAQYPHWEMENSEFSGKTLLSTPKGDLIAGTRTIGKGEALWINLPLGYLKTQTDGLFLHSFLQWMGEDWLGLPTLLRTPNGQGGIILNLHVDSNASMAPLKRMRDLKIFDIGQYSIHFTAGPDARTEGDGLGLDLAKNKMLQAWIQEWKAKKHAIGSHGGWIHDLFGIKMPETATPEWLNFLQWNQEAIEKIAGSPIREYSAPIGNQPPWVSEWLEKRGFNSYYFTGNSGVGPTQSFRGTDHVDKTIWSFPISTYRRVASFEEASNANIPGPAMFAWLNELSGYAKANHTVRVFYFHPPAVHSYESIFLNWLKTNIHWYTMQEIAEFMTARNELKWGLKQTEVGYELNVQPSSHISGFQWALAKRPNQTIKVSKGEASIVENEKEYLISPKNESGFSLSINEVSP